MVNGINGTLNVGQLDAGDDYINSDPFQISISDDAQLGDYSMLLHIMANDGDYLEEFEVELNVSLFQSGFPYDTFDQVRTNPLILDHDGDSDY